MTTPAGVQVTIAEATPTDLSPRRDNTVRLLLLLILALSSLIQLTVVSRTTVDFALRADARVYFSYAYNLRNDGVYSRTETWTRGSTSPVPVPDKLAAPGYPVFLALVGDPAPNDTYLRRVSFVQAGLGVLCVWLLYLVAASFLGRKWALAAALIGAISPHLATINTYLLTESLFYFLLLASVLATQKALTSKRTGMYLLAGGLWGLCSLVRPSVQFLLPVLAIASIVVPRWRGYRSGAFASLACFALVMAPWVIRNQSEAVASAPASVMVNSLLHGSYPDFMYEGKPESRGYPYRADPDSAANSRDLPTVLTYIAGRFQEEPARYLTWYLIGKPIYFLSWNEVAGWDVFIYPVSHTPYFEDARFGWVRLISLFLHWPLVILGLATCLILSLKRRWLLLDEAALTTACFVAVVVLYAVAIHMMVAPYPRYGVPFRPLLFALALLPLRAMILQLRPMRAKAEA